MGKIRRFFTDNYRYYIVYQRHYLRVSGIENWYKTGDK